MTTRAVKAAIWRSQASRAALRGELGISPKTVAKWRKRETVEDLKAGPRDSRSTVLTEAGEAMVVAFRRHTRLPLDDCFYALQPSIPNLTRSSLHRYRCLQRHAISRLPAMDGPSRDNCFAIHRRTMDRPKRQQFERYPIQCALLGL